MNEEPQDLKLGRLLRDLTSAPITLTRAEDKPVTLSFPASSEAPVQRWFGTEVLSHEGGSVRLQRMTGGAAPLLFNHDWNDPVGMVTGARVADGRLMVDAQLFATARAAEIASMVDGGLHNVSIGYEIHEVTEDVKRAVYTATDWEPLEVSIVTVPADPSVGIGRQADDQAKPVRVVRAADQVVQHAAAAVPKEASMADTTAAAGANADTVTRLSPVEIEKERREGIQNLCRANKIDPRTEERWIVEGATFQQVARELVDLLEERGKTKPATAAALGLSNSETQRYSLFRAIRALHYGAKDRQFVDEAAFEIECSRAVAKQLGRAGSTSIFVPSEVLTRPIERQAAERAMAVTPGSKGGYLVNVENGGFVDLLRNRSCCMSMGARVLSGLQGNVAFPRQTGAATLTWQAGEGTSVTATDQTLGQLSMTPKTAIAITDVSEQLLRQSSPSAEAFVMADLARVVALGVDLAACSGTGGAQPLGIKNTTGVTTGQDAATATYAKILAFVSTAAAANAILENPGFVTNAAGAAVLMQRSRFTNTDTPLWEGNILDGTCVGFRALSSEQLAANNLIFGSWGELLIGEWGVLELSTDTGGTRFNQAQVGIRAMWMVDVLVRQPTAFVVSVNLS